MKTTKAKQLAVILGFIVGILSMNSAMAAFNDDKSITCDNCTQSQASNAALATTGTYADYNVYVLDFIGEVLWKFHVESEYESGQIWKQSTPLSPTSSELDIFDGWVDYKNQPKVLGEEIVPPSVGVGSAYDLAGNQLGNEQKINEWLIGNFAVTFGFTLVSPVQGLQAMINSAIQWMSFQAPWTVTVVFPDSSTASFAATLAFSGEEGGAISFQYEKGSGVDSDGNSIPESTDDAVPSSGSFSALGSEPNNASRFMDLMNRYGVGVNGSSSPGMVCGVACSYSSGIPLCNMNCTFP